MPIETENTAERLKPPRVRETAEHLRRTIFIHDGHRHGTRKLRHPLEQVRRRFAAVKRKVREASLNGLFVSNSIRKIKSRR
jgi:hypothetical protein